jgi:hypothetical protein
MLELYYVFCWVGIVAVCNNGDGGSIISVSPFCNPVLLFVCAAVQVTSGTTLQASKPGKFCSLRSFIVAYNESSAKFF